MPLYMQFGSVQGAVTAKGFSNWIHLHSVSHGAARPATFEAGKGAEGRHKDIPRVSDISITKDIDIASTALLRNCIGGKPTDCNIVSVEADEGNQPQEVLRIELKDVLLSNYSCNIGGAKGFESLSISFTSIDISYNHHGPTGKPIKKRAGFDVLAATPNG